MRSPLFSLLVVLAVLCGHHRVVATWQDIDRLELWRRGVDEIPKCEPNEALCEASLRSAATYAKALPVLRHRGGAKTENNEIRQPKVDWAALSSKFGEAFDALLVQNEADHARDCEKSCQFFYCGKKDTNASKSQGSLVSVREISMGSVPPEDFATEFRYPLDLIKVTKEPLLTQEEARVVIENARMKDNVDHNEYTSGKYKLGGDWIKKMDATRVWFNELLKEKIFPNVAASFPEIISSENALRAHSVALLKYNKTHPRTDVHVDNGVLALTLALSPKATYEGGGTFFEHLGEENIVEMDAGHATWRPGSVRHGGHGVSSGERFIVGAFFLLEDRVEHVRRTKNRGSALRAKGDIKGAIKHFEWALAMNPKCTTCMKDLSEALSLEDDLDGAELHLRKALDLLPRDSDALFSLGVILSKKGDDDGALKAYGESASINADDVELLYNLGVKLGEKGDKEKEIRMYESALKADPTFAKAKCNLGVAKAEAGDDIKAESLFLEALRDDPSTALTALTNLAVLYEQRAAGKLRGLRACQSKDAAITLALDADGVLNDAEQTWRRLLHHHHDSTTQSNALDATARLVNVLKTRGRVVAIADLGAAVTHLESASDLAPNDLVLWHGLARAYQLTDNHDGFARAKAKVEALGGPPIQQMQ